MGGWRVKIEDYQGLMKMRNCWIYFSSDRKRLEAFEVVDFGESLGCYSVFILEDVADKRLDVTSVISSAVPF